VYKGGKPDVDISSNKDVKVIFQHNCYFHASFCQDLVGNQRDRFMESLKVERECLLANESAEVNKGTYQVLYHYQAKIRQA